MYHELSSFFNKQAHAYRMTQQSRSWAFISEKKPVSIHVPIPNVSNSFICSNPKLEMIQVSFCSEWLNKPVWHGLLLSNKQKQ